MELFSTIVPVNPFPIGVEWPKIFDQGYLDYNWSPSYNGSTSQLFNFTTVWKGAHTIILLVTSSTAFSKLHKPLNSLFVK